MRLVPGSGAPQLRIAAVGDVGIIGSARARAARDGWDAVFAAWRPHFTAADLGFANLEMPIAEPEWVRPGRSREFWHEDAVAAALVRAGVHVVSLANNHMLDCGPRGIERTIAACRAAGLAHAGAGCDLEAARAPARFERAGRRIVVLAYGAGGADAAGPGRPGIAPLDAAIVTADLARFRAEADVLVVSAHWGSMYVDYPPPRVTALARAFAEAGADVVLGHHPHVVQGAERRGRALVLYSLGDAAFCATAGDVEAGVARDVRRESAVFTVEVGDGEGGVEAHPLRLDADGVPGDPGPEAAAAQGARLAAISEGLGRAAEAFAAEGAPRLLQYELQCLGTYVRGGRWDKVFGLLCAVRPRHLPLLLQAVKRGRSGRGRA